MKLSKDDQKCVDHAMWQKQLTIAYWGLFIVGGFIFIFTDRELAGLLMVALGFIIFNVSFALDIRHAEWHVKQIKKKRGEDE